MAPGETESSYRGKRKSSPGGTIRSAALSENRHPLSSHGFPPRPARFRRRETGVLRRTSSPTSSQEAVDSELEDLDVRIARDLFERAANAQQQEDARRLHGQILAAHDFYDA
jgi:hypothetical protein